MARLEPGEPVALQAPPDRLLVHVAKQDPRGEPAEVGVALQQRLRVEDDGRLEVAPRDAVGDAPAEVPLDVGLRQTQVEADRRDPDPLPELLAVPQRRGPVRLGDLDERGLGILGRLLGGPVDGPLGAVGDVGLGHARVAREQQVLLDEVLDRLDGHVAEPERRRPLRHAPGDAFRWSGIEPAREERLPDGRLDLGRVPRHDLPAPADELERALGRDRDRRRHLLRPVHHERLRHVDGAGRQQLRLGERDDVGERRPGVGRERRQPGEHVGHDAADERGARGDGGRRASGEAGRRGGLGDERREPRRVEPGVGPVVADEEEAVGLGVQVSHERLGAEDGAVGGREERGALEVEVADEVGGRGPHGGSGGVRRGRISDPLRIGDPREIRGSRAPAGERSGWGGRSHPKASARGRGRSDGA